MNYIFHIELTWQLWGWKEVNGFQNTKVLVKKKRLFTKIVLKGNGSVLEESAVAGGHPWQSDGWGASRLWATGGQGECLFTFTSLIADIQCILNERVLLV